MCVCRGVRHCPTCMMVLAASTGMRQMRNRPAPKLAARVLTCAGHRTQAQRTGQLRGKRIHSRNLPQARRLRYAQSLAAAGRRMRKRTVRRPAPLAQLLNACCPRRPNRALAHAQTVLRDAPRPSTRMFTHAPAQARPPPPAAPARRCWRRCHQSVKEVPASGHRHHVSLKIKHA